MPAVAIIPDLVLILSSIVLTVTVLMQEGQRQGLGAIGGGAETFFGKNKAKSMEGRLQNYTKIAAVVFIVLAIVATVVTAHNTGSKAVAAPAEAVEEAVEGVGDEVEEAAEEVGEETSEAVEEATEAAEGAADAVADASEGAAEEAAEAVEEAAETAGN